MPALFRSLPNFSLDYYQKLALAATLLFGSLAVLLWYPLRQVFAGNWILKQQFEIVLYENTRTTEALFNGTLTIRYYALALLTGILSGYALALHQARRHYVASTVIDRLLIGMVIFGLFGARLFFAAFNLDIYTQNPGLLLRIDQGGLAFFGMFLSALLYLLLYCRRYKFSFFEFTDILTLPLLLGQIFGRFGNFFNYEAYGGPTSVFWKMYVPDAVNFYESLNQKFFHPTFLYEIIPNTLLFLIILWSYGSLTKKRSGLVFALYLFGYGTIRFCTEFFRLDALRWSLPEAWRFDVFGLPFSDVRVSQLLALMLVGAGLYIYLVRRHVIYLKKTMVELKTSRRSKIIFN